MLDKIGEDLSHGTIPPSICSSFINECHKSVRGEATDQGRTNNLEQICELSSKTITSLHKKYLHKLHSNNKMLVNPKTLKQNTIITTNPIEDSHNNVYRKNKMKNNVLPLKTCNPLVEQLLQTLTSSVDNSLSSPELITAPPPPPPTATTTPKTNSSSTIPTGVKQSQPTLLNSLTLAQNWCARCFITFRLTSDLVHHMRTHHNQSGRNTNHNKGRLISHNAHIHSSDKLSRKRDIYTEEDYRKEGDTVYSIEQSLLLSTSSLSGSTATFTTTNTPTMMSTSVVPDYSGNKLICSLCSEQFKERHHLTRHMLSHN
ncbi:unnamed protein product [Trichobilharzia regenti]|nr:unnamed protein product [Trichobilharzia regenti]